MPETDTLLVEAKVEPKDIDQVKLGQPVVLRFSAFNQRTTPELNGTVVRVAADTTTDQRTGQSYYIVRISMTAEEIERLGDVKLAPGMPVEAFIQTGERTMMSYLIKPLHDQLNARVPGEVNRSSANCAGGITLAALAISDPVRSRDRRP